MKGLYALVLSVFLFIPAASRAEFIGISMDDFQSNYRAQKDPLWCWASSAEMVLSYQGIKLPQEEIVRRVKGAIVSGTGNPLEMINSTNGIFKDENGRQIVVSGQFVMGAPLPTVLYNQLKQKHPVILTYQASPQFGHAVVVTGIDATITAAGVQVLKIYVFDPFAYRVLSGPSGTNYQYDASLRYKEYVPRTTPFGIEIPAGLITGVIFVDGTAP